MLPGNCPKCEKSINNAVIHPIELIGSVGNHNWRGASYLCPHCRTVLGVQADPMAVKEDTISRILKALNLKEK